jgi:SAM-dependent MidA family methyltransferase
MSSSQLPAPSAEEAALSARLQQRICDEIGRSGGSIGFDRYMEMALYEPGLGYYTAGRRKFGRSGDFITAPEISPLFAQGVARSILPVLAACGAPSILEFGAGSGRLACDLLEALGQQDALPDEYLIMELSPDLRARQRALIAQRHPSLAGRVRWLETLPDGGFEGAVIANEVLDAMPVHLFRITQQGIEEQRVLCDQGRPGSIWAPAGEALVEAVEALGPGLAPGYVSEINLRLAPWLAELGRLLARGACLLVDYGYARRDYYSPDRYSGTLMCHYRHHSNTEPFYLPGLQDITAHVDFTAVAEAADAAGLAVSGYTSQAQFLLGCGVEELLQGMAERQDADWFRQVEGFKRLVLPTEMGERFRVMALTKALQAMPRGFGQDLRFTL